MCVVVPPKSHNPTTQHNKPTPKQGLKYYVPTLYFTVPLAVYAADWAYRLYRSQYIAKKQEARIVGLTPLLGGATRVEVALPGACAVLWLSRGFGLGMGMDGY